MEQLTTPPEGQKNTTDLQQRIIIPLSVTLMGQYYNRIQLLALVAVCRKLQRVFIEQENRRRLASNPFLPGEMSDGWLIVNVPLADIGTRHKNYDFLRRTLKEMEERHVSLAVRNGNDGVNYLTVERFLRIRFGKMGNRAVAQFCFPERVAQHLFSTHLGYQRANVGILTQCRHRATMVMYLFCERWMERSSTSVSYDKLLWLLRERAVFRKFSEFRRRKLDVAKAELRELFRKDIATSYFDYTPIYKYSNGCGDPTNIIIRIYGAASVDMSQVVQYQRNVCSILRQYFHLAQTDAHQLAQRIDGFNYQRVMWKLRDLIGYLHSRRDIKNSRKYVYKTIDNILRETLPGPGTNSTEA